MPCEGKGALMSGGVEGNTCVKWRRREHLCQVEEKGTVMPSKEESIHAQQRGQKHSEPSRGRKLIHKLGKGNAPS